MHGNDLPPNYDRTRQIQQRKITLRLLFIPDQQLPESVQPRMSNFNYPTPRLEFRVVLYFLLFFPSWTNVRNVALFLYRFLSSNIPRIQTKILNDAFSSTNYDASQSFIQ